METTEVSVMCQFFLFISPSPYLLVSLSSHLTPPRVLHIVLLPKSVSLTSHFPFFSHSFFHSSVLLFLYLLYALSELSQSFRSYFLYFLQLNFKGPQGSSVQFVCLCFHSIEPTLGKGTQLSILLIIIEDVGF